MTIVHATLIAAEPPATEPWPSLGRRARRLAPVGNRPLLLHAIDAVDAAGVPNARIVVDDRTGPEVRAALSGGCWRTALACVQDRPLASRRLDRLLADTTGSAGAVLVMEGDLVLRERLDSLAAQMDAERLDAVALTPAARNAGAEPVAGCLLSADALDALRDAPPPGGLQQLVAAVRGEGGRVGVRTVDACLPSRGPQEWLLDANRQVLEQLPEQWRDARVTRSKVQGPVVLDPSVELVGTVVRGPAIVGAGSRVLESYIGPYTSIGARVTLEGVEIEHSIVLEDAELRFAGARIESSVIGRGARMVRDFRAPRAMRLSIGDHAEVALP